MLWSQYKIYPGCFELTAGLHRTKKKNGPQTGWPPCLQAAVLKAAVRRFAIISFRHSLSTEHPAGSGYQLPIMEQYMELLSILEKPNDLLILFDQNIGPFPILEKQSHLLPAF